MTVLVERRSIVDDRFEKPVPREFSSRNAFLSILTMLLMFSSSVYFYDRLRYPCTIFHLLSQPEPKKGFFRRSMKPTVNCLDGDESIYKRLKCLVYHQAKDFTCHEDFRKSKLWMTFPFVAAMVGSGFGLLLELYLLFTGTAFQFDATPIIASVTNFRASLLALVLTSTLLTTVFLTFHPDEYTQVLFVMINAFFFCTFALAILLFFHAEDHIIPLLVMMTQVTQIWIAVANGSNAKDPTATYILASVGFFHLIGMLGGADTPLRSAFYHVMATLSMVSLFVSIALVGNEDPTYATRVYDDMFPEGDVGLALFTYIASSIGGIVLSLMTFRNTWHAFRSMASQAVWSTFYMSLMAQPILQTNPYKLSDVYAKTPPRKITLQPYSKQHHRYMPKTLAIPSIAGDELPATIEMLSSLVKTVGDGFGFITTLGQFFPESEVDVPLDRKVRMNRWSDGTEYWPRKYFSLASQFPERGLNMLETPRPMVESYKDGQILAYLCQYGVGNAFLKKARETDTYPFFELVDLNEGNPSVSPVEGEGLVVDFTHLETYKTKPDYEAYGGVVFFKFKQTDDNSMRLEVGWLVVPCSKRRTMRDKMSGTYRRGESMITASLYFSVICGKHLAELHMTFNLLEVALVNAFDHEMNVNSAMSFDAHPFRLALYVHLFSHGLAVELSVGHLIEKGAVFNQIFALEYSSLIDYISHIYDDFEYAVDEDFEYREAIQRPLMDHPDPRGPSFNCSMSWESEYRTIFENYATKLVDAMYASDLDVENDPALQSFINSIDKQQGGIFGSLPKRHDLKTKAGISRFLSDTIYHLTVRHEVYGTTSTIGALDPRVGMTMVPRDGGPHGLDEWRSTTYVAMVTAYPAFIHLLQDPANVHPQAKRRLDAVFDDATPIPAEMKHSPKAKKELVVNMRKAWDIMQHDLRALHEKWSKDNVGGKRAEGDDNFKYFRPLPAELHTGPGY